MKKLNKINLFFIRINTFIVRAYLLYNGIYFDKINKVKSLFANKMYNYLICNGIMKKLSKLNQLLICRNTFIVFLLYNDIYGKKVN